MGTFKVRMEIGDPAGNSWELLEALVDTGATYTMLPAPLLRRLGVSPYTRDVFTLADGRQGAHDIGHGWIRVDGRAVITQVVFGEAAAEPVRGAYALEGLRLAPDPVGRRLVPAPGLLRAVRDSPAAGRAATARGVGGGATGSPEVPLASIAEPKGPLSPRCPPRESPPER